MSNIIMVLIIVYFSKYLQVKVYNINNYKEFLLVIPISVCDQKNIYIKFMDRKYQNLMIFNIYNIYSLLITYTINNLYLIYQ